MVLNFVEKVFSINGGGDVTSPFTFYKNGFEFGSLKAPEPTWQDIILSGNTALTLVNAKADGLNYVKLFGECELRNLPLGYTQLDWIQGDDGVYIDTGITPSCDVLRVKWKGQLVGSTYQGSFFGCVGGTAPRAGFRIFSNANTAELTLQSYSSLLNPGYQVTNINTIDITYDNINKTITGYCNSTAINETNANIDVNFNKNMLLFGAYIGDTLGAAMASKCWGVLVEKDGVVVLNYIPAKRNSDNAIGMYDTVTGTFLTNAGTGDFVAGGDVVPSIDNPVDIVTNNGVLKYGKCGKNLFDKSTADANRLYGYFPSSGTEWHYAAAGFSVRIPCLPNTTYTARYNGNSTQAVLGFGSYASDSTPAPSPSPNSIVTVSQAIRQNEPTINTPITLTTKANDKWLIVAYNIAEPQHTDMANNLQIEIGSTATAYEPYHLELYVDGTTETVNIHNKNIWSNSKTSVSGVGYSITDTNYGFIATAGASTGNSSRAVIYVDVDVFKANTTYVISGIDGYKSIYVGRTVNGVNDNGYYKNGGSGRYFTISDIAEGQTKFTISIYLGTKDKGFEFDFSHIQIEEGSSSTEYVIPYNGGTVTAENLLSVDEYRDVQNVLTGEVTSNVMTYVVDGTEDWEKYRANNGYSCFRILSGLGLRSKARIGISNYLPYYNVVTTALDRECFTIGSNMNTFYITLAGEDMTLTEFTNWLKGLCNAGKPFIVVLPRYTSVTSIVTPQSLTTQQGTNIIEITQASIDGLPLEVSYKGGVSVTITEVQNANLSNSVTVTIGE